MSKIKAVFALSGGLDSAVALAVTMETQNLKPEEVIAVTFYYGSKHAVWETRAAEKVRQYYSIAAWTNHLKIDLSAALEVASKVSSLGAMNPAAIPEGHYNDETMRSTVIPGRNLMFLSVLASVAEASLGGMRPEVPVKVVLGVHQGDHHIYPDCRPEFVRAAGEAVCESTDYSVGLYTPLLDMDKAAIVRAGIAFKVPFRHTRTCYKNQERSCGKCGSCVERLEAFAANGITDPILYEGQ